jgi:hypothetical protein
LQHSQLLEGEGHVLTCLLLLLLLFASTVAPTGL